MNIRYHLIDVLRGFAVVLMLAYHTTWDLIYIFGVRSNLLETPFAQVWQFVGACTFILLSGFCWSMGRRPLRSGAICFGCGALMTLVTLVAMPQNRVVFGVLTLLGSCMLLMVPLRKVLYKVPAWCGALVSAVLFFLMYDMRSGTLGFGGWQVATLPRWLYQNYFTAYLGFPQRGFYSTDYFPLLPWLFLYLCGYFLYRCAADYLQSQGRFWQALQYKIAPLGSIGRHSLVIYLFHQPIIYGALSVAFALFV